MERSIYLSMNVSLERLGEYIQHGIVLCFAATAGEREREMFTVKNREWYDGTIPYHNMIHVRYHNLTTMEEGMN